MASGTISGREPDSFGSLLELTWNGSKPLVFSDSQQRTFLQDGDSVKMTGHCKNDSYSLGFGELTGLVEAALD